MQELCKQFPHETVPTNWYIDYRGRAADLPGRPHGRPASEPFDVLMLTDLRVGETTCNEKHFFQAGNALSSGPSRLGSFSHDKRPATVSAVATYPDQHEMMVDTQPIIPPEAPPLNQAAKAEIHKIVEDIVLKLIRNPRNDFSGDWDEAIEEGKRAAAAQLPEGSKLEVTIKTKLTHKTHKLGNYPYTIDKPAKCTIHIEVPDTTTTRPEDVRGSTHQTQITGAVALRLKPKKSMLVRRSQNLFKTPRAPSSRL